MFRNYFGYTFNNITFDIIVGFSFNNCQSVKSTDRLDEFPDFPDLFPGTLIFPAIGVNVNFRLFCRAGSLEAPK